jgi:EpsD family peptidyl-prolyl cis-trans isomerase
MRCLPATALASILCSGALLLAGCGKSSTPSASNSQVLARVNGDEISVHQINTVLTKLPASSPGSAEQMRKNVLDKVIEQQLIYQKAIAKNLDRNPDVAMTLDAAKREIVARAYLDQIASSLPKPSDSEVAKYFASNPDLFSKRRIYAMQEIQVEPKAGIAEELQSYVESGHSMDEIIAWLKTKGVGFQPSMGQRPAEQIPLDLLPKIAALPEGKVAVLQGEQNLVVVKVISAQPAPLDEPTARPRIQMFLANQIAMKAIGDEINRLKSDAKIEYAAQPGAGSTPGEQTQQQAVVLDQNSKAKGVAALR